MSQFCFIRDSPLFRSKEGCLMLIIAAVVAAVAFVRCFSDSFWGDECYSILLCDMSYSDIIEYQKGDVHPPLYHLILKAFTDVFGMHPWVYHFASVVPFLLVLMVCFTFIRKDFGVDVALVMVVFCSLSPAAFKFALEVRMYEWGFLFVLLVLVFAHRYLKSHSWKDMVWVTLFAVLAAYTHLYCLMGVTMMFLGLMVLNFRYRKNLIVVLAGFVAFVIAYIPWMYTVFDAVDRVAKEFWITDNPPIIDIVSYLSGIHTFPVTSIFMLSVVTITFLTSVGLVKRPICSYLEMDGLKGTERQLMFLMIVCIVGTLATPYVFSEVIKPVFIVRYTFPVLCSFWLLFSLSITRYKQKKMFILGLVVLLVVFVPFSSYDYSKEHHQDEDTEDFLEMMDDISENDHIITDSYHLDWTVLDYYFPKCQHVLLEDDLISLLSAEKHNWLFLRNVITDDMSEQLQNAGYSILTISEDCRLSRYDLHVYSLIP